MARWIEVLLRVDGEAAEAAAQELQRWCYQGVAVEQVGIPPDEWDEEDVPPPQELIVRGYFPDDENAAATREAIDRAIRYMNMMYPISQPIYSVVDEENWAEAWKAHYRPVRLGKHILIRPLWIEVQPEPDDIVIALDPGQAFGTGTHPTTQLCLQALEWAVQRGDHVLDLGCGSGILAIAAARLHARQVVAVDIDAVSVRATIENAAQNGVADRITALQGDLQSVLSSARRFDLVVVNILAKVIIRMCEEKLGQVVRPGGTALFSGIIEDQAAEVEEALRRTGLEPHSRKQQGDWMLIVARRPTD